MYHSSHYENYFNKVDVLVQIDEIFSLTQEGPTYCTYLRLLKMHLPTRFRIINSSFSFASTYVMMMNSSHFTDCNFFYYLLCKFYSSLVRALNKKMTQFQSCFVLFVLIYPIGLGPLRVAHFSALDESARALQVIEIMILGFLLGLLPPFFL